MPNSELLLAETNLELYSYTDQLHEVVIL